MRNQERCFLRSVAGFCLLLGGVILFSSSNLVVPAAAAAAPAPATDDQSSQIFTTTTTAITTAFRDGDDADDDVDVLAVRPLRGEESSSKDSKLKELDSKMILESKKKSVGEFKVKPDQKYSKTSKDEDAMKLNKNGEHEHHDSMTTSTTTTTTPTTTTTMSSMFLSPTDKMNFTVPLLFHGAPLVTTFNDETSTVLYSSTTEDDTVGGGGLLEVRTTEETLASSRGRALNISAPEPTNSLHANLTDLSDVSMDDDDKEVEGGEYVAPYNATIPIGNSTLTFVTSCTEGNRTYDIGEPIIRGCNEKCVCGGGGEAINCEPMCHFPYFKAGTGNRDPLCQESILEDQPCCAMLVCEADSALEPDETCVFGNKTVTRGQRVEDGCAKICVCEAGGHLKCQARCPPNETNSAANQHDRCVALTDPRDACCTITLCDVTLGDHEIKPENSTELTINITDIKVLNSTSIKLKLTSKNPEDVVIELSDNNHVWRQQNPDKDGVITNLEPAHTYYVRVTENGRNGPALQVTLPAEVIKTNITEKLITDHNVCIHRGKSYKIGTNWYDECISFCTCGKDGKAECVTIECPTDFGLDVLDPHCLDWETVPANFVPKAPQCCPQEVRCRNNGSCSYEGKVYDNWSELPSNVTGCEKRCYCEMGNVSCQAACPPVPALPPPNLQCPPHQASLVHAPDDECCLHWACAHPSSQIPGKNTTSALTSPSATTSNDIDKSHKKSQDKSNQEPDHGVSFPPSSWENTKPQTFDITTNNNQGPLIHYPMDPGHPTVPYNGPYNPDYKPTHPSVENVFHLSPPSSSSSSSSSSPSTTTSTHVDSKPSITKDKTSSKPKLEQTKKPVEPMKPHPTKDTSSNVPQYFPGPLAPDKFPDKMIPSVDHKIHSENPNKLAAPMQKGTLPNVVPQHPSPEQPHFIPLNPQGPTSPADASFPFAPHNGENIPPGNFDHIQYENSAVGPPYGGDPNFIIPNPSKVNPKKKQQSSLHDDLVDKTKISSIPGRPKQNQRNPEQDILPDELYHLINLQHPGLIQLEHAPPQGHPGLYEIHQQHITSGAAAAGGGGGSGQRQPAPGYFGTAPTQVPKKSLKPHIFAQKNPENGETTYHIHTPEIPSSQQQIEELLAHISQHDSNPGPFQQYPSQPAIPHNIAPSGPSLPLHVDAHTSHSGLTHLNHPFAAQTPNQSGLDHNVHPGFPVSGFPVQPPSEEITVQMLDALNEHTVRLVFTVPQVLVGLHGRVELRYTSDKLNLDPSTWRVQVFAPPNDLIATPQLEFELGDLKPSTEYKVKITVKLKDLANSPTSRIYSVRTLDKRPEITTLPPQIPIDAELRVMETNSSWVNVMWKKFTEYELQFIDGVQLRYKEKDSKVYAATPLIHRAVTNYVIENLKPATTYEIGIYVIPFPGQNTELISEKEIQVTTLMEPDPYSFDVKVEIKTIKSTDVEVSWSGVPYPEDKYVNIYRAIYQSDSGKEDTSTFKIAKRDSPAKTVIMDLKPGTRYRLWIEVYLTNGKIKKSNVQDFVTKPGVLLPASVSQQAGKLASISLHEGDYYGPLVIVAIVASLAILSTLILLMMLMKRRTSSKADISPRKTTSAYDNPSYKTCEDAAPITNGRNKITDHEMATININAKDTA